jgi:hypothetical protein
MKIQSCAKSFSLPCSFWNCSNVQRGWFKIFWINNKESLSFSRGKHHVIVDESKITPSTIPLVVAEKAFSNFGHKGANGIAKLLHMTLKLDINCTVWSVSHGDATMVSSS